MDVDFIAVSFVKTADVINNLKSYLTSRCDKVIEIVAKIESHDSVPNAQDIIEASDAVMIARGDLGTALPCLALPMSESAVQLSLNPGLSCPLLAPPAAIQVAALHTLISSWAACCYKAYLLHAPTKLTVIKLIKLYLVNAHNCSEAIASEAIASEANTC